jgi:hypothetical protein|tara:strand:+ start:705 stop:1229 length:525 start_codon:yes stop_codon:yes gene_type:complete
MRACSGDKNNQAIPDPITITETVTKWDTVTISSLVYVPKWKTKTEIIHDTILADIDTVSILKDYYAKYSYTDTINLDTLGYITINDTITRNSISFRDVQSNLFIPTTTITNTIYLNKREFFGGISVGSTPTAIQNLNGEILFVNKKRQAYGIGVGINNTFMPIYTLRMYWKIGK